jgi:hypothetical protein
MPCTKAGNSCIYPAEDDQGNDDVPESKVKSSPQISPRFPEQHHIPHKPFENEAAYPQQGEAQLALVQNTPGMMPEADQRQMEAQRYNGNTAYFQSMPESHSMEMISPEMVSFPTTSPTHTGNEYNHSMAHLEGYLPGEFSYMPSNSAPRIAGMVEGGVDWLNLEFESPTNSEMHVQYQSGPVQSAYPLAQMPASLVDAINERVHPAVSAQLMPIRNQDPKSPPAASSESQAGAHQWPFDHTRNPDTQKCRLPPLRDILHGAALSNEHDNGAIIKSLIQLMSSAFLPEADISMDMNMVSAMDLLKTSLDLYFSEFHAVSTPFLNPHQVDR